MHRRSGTRWAYLVTGLLVVPLGGPSPAVAQEKENPILTFVKSRVKAADKPFTLIVVLKAKEGEAKKLEAVFAPALKATRKEKGCLAYDLNRDTADATRFLVYERWQSVAALDAHLKTEHIKTLLAELPALTAGPPSPQVLLPAGD